MSQKGQVYTRYWVFRVSNPADDNMPAKWPEVCYVVWQKEKAESGLIHLQGYVVFNDRKRLSWLKQKCDNGAHFEPRRGNHDQAKAYSTKQETRVDGPWEAGEEPVDQRGKRGDLLSLKRKLDEGASLKDCAEDEELFPVVAKYHRWVSIYQTLTGKQRTWPTETVVYWGPPGIGKSSRALQEGGPDAFWLCKPAGQTTWWDGYCGQEVVVIDEFYGWIARDLMCRICDRYPLNVEIKGGSTPFLAKKIIITSNVHPMQWWPKAGLGAMERRLSAPLGRIEFMANAVVLEVPPAPAAAPIEVPLSDPVMPRGLFEAIGESIPATPLSPIQEEDPIRVLAQAVWEDDERFYEQVNRIRYQDWE